MDLLEGREPPPDAVCGLSEKLGDVGQDGLILSLRSRISCTHVCFRWGIAPLHDGVHVEAVRLGRGQPPRRGMGLVEIPHLSRSAISPYGGRTVFFQIFLHMVLDPAGPVRMA